MDPSHTAYCYDTHGLGGCVPNGKGGCTPIPTSFDHSPRGDIPSPGTADIDRSRRGDVAASVGIGAADSKIPSEQDIRDQLEAAKNSNLPVGASKTATAGYAHRNCNYAPGCESASRAVPQRTYTGTGHDPNFLPHEEVGSPEHGSDSPSSRAPDLPPRPPG